MSGTVNAATRGRTCISHDERAFSWNAAWDNEEEQNRHGSGERKDSVLRTLFQERRRCSRKCRINRSSYRRLPKVCAQDGLPEGPEDLQELGVQRP
ncbi:hypothetical protein MTO96_047841 [Rhipicephalus appendiculatus]